MPDPNQTVNAGSLTVGNADCAGSELTSGTLRKTPVKTKSAPVVNSQLTPTAALWSAENRGKATPERGLCSVSLSFV